MYKMVNKDNKENKGKLEQKTSQEGNNTPQEKKSLNKPYKTKDKKGIVQNDNVNVEYVCVKTNSHGVRTYELRLKE